MGEPEHAVTDLSEFRGRRVAPPAALPTGTVTFLLTDIEGSTRLWEDRGAAMASAVARHYEILDGSVAVHRGVRPIEQGEGDSLVAAFTRASDAVAAALAAGSALRREEWPEGIDIAVRMALHTGEAQLRDERYYTGPSIIRCARLRALAHGGQVLISNTTADLLAEALPDGAALLPLGVHRLRDLRQPERVFQLIHPSIPVRFPPLRSLDVLPNNLPAQLTSFVGREAELAELDKLLGPQRLVTLVGAGGCGKTRLAAQLAAEVAEAYPDGVWWVDLAPLTDPGLVPRAVMGALELLDTRGLDPLERITGYLRHRRVLLVLDNCEHVLASTAALVDGMLRGCPDLAALATSREALGVAGESAWRVPPLALPADEEPSAETILASEAVRLFLERAADARPGFVVDASGAATVAAICARLDGIPLAIELAAARIRSLSPQRVLDGLAHRFRLLTGGARTAVARQQTLEASVEWSHDLLSDTERVLFRRLAAFSGGFSLEAAEEVCALDSLESWEILTLLSDLVDKSLVVFDGERYRLLQTIHDFANGRLLAAGEADAVRARHVVWFTGRAEAAAAELERGPTPEVLARLDEDHDNLRAAMEWALATKDDESALRLVGALTLFWHVHGNYSESLDWYRRVLAAVPADPSPLRAKALWGLGHLGLFSMDVPGGYGTAETEQAAALARELEDPVLLGRALVDQSLLMLFAAPDAAVATLEQAAEAARRADDDWTLASALSFGAFTWIFDRDRPDLAGPSLDELSLRSDSLYWRVWRDMCLGLAYGRQGRLSEGSETLAAALAGAWKLGDPQLEAFCAAFLSDLRISLGDYEGASSVATRSLAWQCRSAFTRAELVQIKLAVAALAQGELTEAGRHLEAASPALRQCGIPFAVQSVGMVGGRLALEQQELATARAAFEEASAIAANLETPWLMVEGDNALGRLALAEGDLATAEDLHHRALAICVERGFRGVAAETLEALAALAGIGESHAEGARLFGAARALRESTGQQRWLLDQPAHDAAIAELRSRLGDAPFDQGFEEGMALQLEEAAAYASRARGERKRPSTGWAALTPTELEVVRLAAQGLTNAEIGGRLFISPGTAKIHLSHIYAKLGVANRTELAARATARGLAGGGTPARP